jgi:hypothetical protein
MQMITCQNIDPAFVKVFEANTPVGFSITADTLIVFYSEVLTMMLWFNSNQQRHFQPFPVAVRILEANVSEPL